MQPDLTLRRARIDGVRPVEKAVPSLTPDYRAGPKPPIGTGDPRVAAYVVQSGRSVGPIDQAELETEEARALWAWWRRAAETGTRPHEVRLFRLVQLRIPALPAAP